LANSSEETERLNHESLHQMQQKYQAKLDEFKVENLNSYELVNGQIEQLLTEKIALTTENESLVRAFLRVYCVRQKNDYFFN
jgi:hypothetical protein